MAGYDITQTLRISRVDQWAQILPGSIQQALKRLDAEGFVVLQQTERTGHREKVVYAITPAGREELTRLLREAWSQPMRELPAQLYLALNFLDALPRHEVLEALAAHAASLEAEIALWDKGAQAKLAALPSELRPAFTAGFDNGREHLEADLRLVRRLRETLTDTSLTHPPLDREDGEA
jgi:DNA-binding PadR family transcriptional regulator